MGYLKKIISIVYKRFFKKPETGKSFGSLTESQLRYIQSLSEAIYEPSDPTQREDLYKIVMNYIHSRTLKDGFWNAYKEGIEALKTLTKQSGYSHPFYELSMEERKKIILKINSVNLDIYQILQFRKDPLIFFNLFIKGIIYRKYYRGSFFLIFIKKDLYHAIFTSHLGWSLVGYTTWPGIEINPLAFTKMPKQ